MASNSQAETSPSSPTHPQSVTNEVWPSQTTTYNETNCVNRDDSLHTYGAEQLTSPYKNNCQSSAQVVSYQESTTSLFSVQPSSTTGGFTEVSLHTYNDVDGSNDYQEATTPPSIPDGQQYEAHHLEQNEALSAEVVVGASQVSSRSQTPATSNHSRSATPCCTAESGMITIAGISPDGNSLGSTLERVTLSVEQQFALQNAIAVSQQGIASLGLPIILDRNNIAAIITASRADAAAAAVGFDPSMLQQRSLIPSHNLAHGLSQRAILTAEQLQFINSAEAAAVSSSVSLPHNLLPPVISQRDLITVPSTSSMSSVAPSQPQQSHFLHMHHKQMLAQKYAAELESSASNPVSESSSQLLEHLNLRNSSTASYVTTAASGSLIDARTASLYSTLSSGSTLPTTSISQSGLPLETYAVVERGVDLVSSSSREEAEDLLEAADDGQQAYASSTDQTASHRVVVQSYAPSSVADLLPSQAMHAIQASDSRQKLTEQDEVVSCIFQNVVDSSDNYVRHANGSPDVDLSLAQGYGHSLSELHSASDAVTTSSMHPVLNGTSSHEGNEVLTSSEPEFVSIDSHHFIKDENDETSLERLQNCATVSSATHPDSTHGSRDLALASSVSSDLLPAASTSVDTYEHPRPRRDLKSGRHWCDDCNQFYEKDCPTHRIQLIFDKPVLSRAWASLPATYLYVLQIGNDTHNEPVYGVFAKKTIPKRTQFGPIEGVLVKTDSIRTDGFILLVDQTDGVSVVLDTSDESLSNWMCFVRPAENYKEQNLVLVQQGLSLYFNTTRAINPKTELRVWYSPTYAEKFSLPLLEPDEEEKKVIEEQELAWPCYECNKRFMTSEELQRHLNQHDEETGENEGKSRSRIKGRSKFTKVKLRRHSKPKVSNEAAITSEEEKKALCLNKSPKKPKAPTSGSAEEGNSESLPSPDNSRNRTQRKHKTSSKQEEYECDVCHKVFPRNYSLQRHLIMHSGEKKYKCPICDMKFSHVYNRNRHVRRHRLRGEDDGKKTRSLYRKRNQGSEWVCSHCQLTFDKSSVLNLHILTHAAEDVGLPTENGFSIDNQGVVANIYREANNMLVFEGAGNGGSEVDMQSLKCPQCEQEFETKRDLINHASSHGKMMSKHRTFRGLVNPLKPYKCSLCYKSFASDERLIRHFLVHGSEESKPLQCEVCGKRFLNNSALACHVKVHSEERKVFECPMCKQEFEQIISLKDHVHVHYINHVYSCPHCPKKFEEYNQIRKHIRAFHSDKRYPCDQCDKVFPRPDKLKLHMLRHSNHREFLCANCGKQFKRKDKLKEHMKRLHAPDSESRKSARASKTSTKKFVPKVSPTDYHRFIYKCHTCLLGFKRRGMLVNHLAKRHPDIPPDSVPELNLPILKTTRDYYCQYCEKVYKSSSKRKAHILKNHPGAELPMSNRRKGGVPEIPGMPNPTFSQTVGSITTHPHHCNWCHKQYASKAKLLQHQRKKHMDMMTLPPDPAKPSLQLENVVSSEAQSITSQIVITQSLAGSVASTLLSDGAVVIDTSKRKIQFIERDAVTGEMTVTAPSEAMHTDLLTQAMSELTQSLTDYRASAGDFLNTRVTQGSPVSLLPNSPPEATPIPSPAPPPSEAVAVTTATTQQEPSAAQQTPSNTPVPTPVPVPTSSPSPVFSASAIHTPATLDPNQLSQLLAQYQQPLSPQSLAAVTSAGVTTQSFIGRSWPATVTSTFTSYPAR